MPVTRRALLRAGGLVAVGGGLVLAGPGLGAVAGPAQLTASSLRRLLGRRVDVRSASSSGTAVVRDVVGNGPAPVRERSFTLVLEADLDLDAAGETVEVRHDSIGRQVLFAVPERVRTTWAVVVQDLEAVTTESGR